MSRRTVPGMSRFSSRAKAQTSSINPIEEKPREVSEIMLYNGSTVVFGNMLLNRVSYEEARLVPFGEWHEHLTQVIGAGFFTPHYWAVIS